MPYRVEIDKAVTALLSIQRDDGGIPATSIDAYSGCWTTADTLESILTTGVGTRHPLSKITQLIEFLLATQFQDVEDDDPYCSGSWPLYRDSKRTPSAMSTGHALSSLVASSRFLDSSPITDRILISITNGFAWLDKVQNSDGGWGTQPGTSGTGTESTVISIVYVLRAYYQKGFFYNNSTYVRKAVDYLVKVQNKDGSWAGRVGREADPTNTARAVFAIIQSNYNKPEIINRALEYIKSEKRSGNDLWAIGAERFDIDDAPAQLIYNKNANCDILNAFLINECCPDDCKEILNYLLSSQKESGFWNLSSPTQEIEDITTWSTSEWIRSIDLAAKKRATFITVLSCKKYIIYLWVMGFTILFYLVYLNYGLLSSLWSNASETFKNTVIYAIFTASLVGLFTNIITEPVQSFLKRIFKNRDK